MNRKKLYKSKKKWIIGICTGMLLILGGTITDVNADNKLSTNTKEASDSAYFNIDSSKNNVHNEGVVNTNGTDFNGKYLTKSVELWRNTSENKVDYDYSISQSPKVSIASNNSNLFQNKETKIKKFNQFEYVKTNLNTSRKFNNYSYTLQSNEHNDNYKSASYISNEIAKNDNEILDYNIEKQRLKDNDSLDFNWENKHDIFDDNSNNPVYTIVSGHSNKENVRNAINPLAYKNRPIVTYDNNGYLSFIQSSVVGHGFYDYALDYDNGWSGYTFYEGRQLPLDYFVNSGNVSKFMKGIAFQYKDNAPFLYTDEDVKTGLVLSAGSLNYGPTAYFLTSKGIFAFYGLNGISGNFNPTAILLPNSLIKPEFQYLFCDNEFKKNIVKDDNNFEDINDDNNEFFKKNIDILEVSEGILRSSKITEDSENVHIVSTFNDIEKLNNKTNDIFDFSTIAIKIVNDITYIDKSFCKVITNIINKASSYINKLFNLVAEKMKGNGNNFQWNRSKKFSGLDKLDILSDATSTFNDYRKVNRDNSKQNDKTEVRKKQFKKTRDAHISFLTSFVTSVLDLSNKIIKNPIITGILSFGGAALIGLGIWNILNNFSSMLPSDWSDNNLLKSFKLRRKKK